MIRTRATARARRATAGHVPDGMPEARLAAARALLGWSPVRTDAFRRGWRDGTHGTVDPELLHRHTPDHGFLEASLVPDLVRSLGYRDGVQASEVGSSPSDTSPTDQDGLVDMAAPWAPEDVDPATYSWQTDTGTDPAVFLATMSREAWISWFVQEHEWAVQDGRPGYGDLLVQDVREPVVWTLDERGAVEIWDGHHRIAAVFAKDASSIPSLRGHAPTPLPVP